MEDAINLLQYWRMLRKYLGFIFVFAFLSSVVAIVIVKRLPNVYESNTTIMPVPQGGNSVLMNPLIGGVGSLLAGSIGGGNVTGKALLITILSSRTLSENVIAQNKNRLLGTFYPDQWDSYSQAWKPHVTIPPMTAIGKKLRGIVRVKDDPRTPLIEIRVESTDPVFATDVARMYTEALQQYISDNTLTQAKKNRSFIENSLEQKSKELLESGKELAKFYETNVISKVGALVDVDTQISSRRYSETNSVVKQVPQQIYLQYLTEQLSTLKTITAMLASEYEKSKIAENKEELTFQVIDPPQIPLDRIKPNRSQLVMLTFVVSIFAALLMSLLWEKYHPYLKVPQLLLRSHQID